MKNPSHFNDSESPYLTPTSEEKEDLIKEISAKESKRTYQCAYPDCGKLFSFKSEITRHILIHKETRPHTCSYEDCSKTFKRKDALVNHLKLHEEVLPYLCDAPECGKRFATKAAIRYHKMTHDNKRTYKCNINGCRKSFLTPSQLKQHQSASYIHFKKSKSSKAPPEISQEELFTARISNELNQGVVKSEPKPGEIIQWETKSQRNDPNAPQKNETEKFDALYSYLLRENQILREKMQEYQKSNNLYEKEQNQQTFRFEPDDTIFQLLPQDLSMFISSDELKFLEFHQEG